MLNYDEVFRVRIDERLNNDIATALAKWRKKHRWVRPGVLYRKILTLGLAALKREK